MKHRRPKEHEDAAQASTCRTGRSHRAPGSEDRGRGEGRHAGTLAGSEDRGGGRGRHTRATPQADLSGDTVNRLSPMRANREPDRQIRPGRFWWIPVVRGVFALLLGIAILVKPDDRAMIANFIGVYWLVSGLLTIRWALTVRWIRGSRIGLAAGGVSVIAAVLVLLRHPFQHLISPNTLINVLGVAAVLTGSLRLLGAFEIERRTGRRWTFGGLALGSVEVVLGARAAPRTRPERACARDRVRGLGAGGRKLAPDRGVPSPRPRTPWLTRGRVGATPRRVTSRGSGDPAAKGPNRLSSMRQVVPPLPPSDQACRSRPERAARTDLGGCLPMDPR